MGWEGQHPSRWLFLVPAGSYTGSNDSVSLERAFLWDTDLSISAGPRLDTVDGPSVSRLLECSEGIPYSVASGSVV